MEDLTHKGAPLAAPLPGWSVSKMNRLRLQYQIALATFLPLVVFGLLTGVVATRALRTIPEQLVIERQTELAQVAAAGVAGTLRGQVRLLEMIAAELGENVGSPARQQEILDNWVDALSAFGAGVCLLDAQGTAIAASPAAAGSLHLSFADQSYFRDVRATQAPIFSPFLRDRPTGRPAIVIAVPVQRSGSFAGVLIGKLALDQPEWARDLNLLRSPEGGKAYLVDGASVIIYHPDTTRIGRSIQSDPGLWRLVIAGKPQGTLYYAPDSTEETIATYAPIPAVGWGLIVEEPWQVIVASIVPSQLVGSGLMALGMVVALVALVVSVNRVTRPLNALVAQGQRVVAGEAFQPLPVEGSPDLRMLLQAVNDMVGRLGEQQAALRHYALEVLRGQEDERLRISRELHDGTVQGLVALTQRIELCADELDETPAAARARLRELQTLAHKTLTEVRRLSNNLRPSILEDLGLVAALRVLTRELGEQLPQVHVDCEIVGPAVRLSPELELAAFRVAQEALANVRKHAHGATQAKVVLLFEDEGLMLTVEDDGCGFDVPATANLIREGHLGLAGMVERAQLLGGGLEISSVPSQGTTITLRLPTASQDSPIS